MRVLSGLAVALALSLVQASPTPAQTPPAAARPAEFEVKAELVRRYFVVIQFEKLMSVSMESMMDTMLAGTNIPDDKYELVRDSVLEAYEAVLPEMIEANVAMYAEAFTREELEGLVAFYESPIGQSLMVKSVMLSRNSGEVLARFQPIMEAETLRRLCARMACPAPVAAPRETGKRR
jgi:hypothetical protein